jgi:hypothetical protein
MKFKLSILLIFSFLLNKTIAQVPNTACNNVTAPVITNGTHPSVINGSATPAPILTQQTLGLPRTEYLVIKKGVCAKNNSGNCDTTNGGGDVIIGTDVDGIFYPGDMNRYGITLSAGDTFSIVPFAYNLGQLRNLVNQILTGLVTGTTNSCCAIFTLDIRTIGFCDSLINAGITSVNDVNNLGDFLTVIESISSVNQLSIYSFLYYLQQFNGFSSIFDASGCGSIISSGNVLCYGANPNQKYNYVAGNCISSNIVYSISVTSDFACTNNGQANIIIQNPSSYNFMWSNGVTAQNANNLAAGTYFVTMTNIFNGCSVTEVVFINNSFNFPNSEICLVSVDSTDGKNNIIWDKIQNQGIQWYKIYKQNSTTSLFDSIGIVHIDSFSIFKDNNSNPSQQSASYRISAVDSCGYELLNFNDHTTIHLSANQGVNNNVNLQWNAYDGFNYSNFEIYRSNNGSPYSMIGTVANNSFSFTDLTPPSSTNYYFVAVTKPTPCNPSKSAAILKSVSNILDGQGNPVNSNTNIQNPNDLIKISPNPSSDFISIQNLTSSPITNIAMYDMLGRELLNKSIYVEDLYSLELSCTAGTYFLKIETENGIIAIQKVIKL